MTDLEEWRPVVGWEGLYEVSSHGRVRSLRRVVDTGAMGKRALKGRIRKPQRMKHGHLKVQLRDGDRLENLLVHRMVAQAFIPNPEGYRIVRHWDDNPYDNRVENLRWGTHTDNQLDSVRNGTHPESRKTHCPAGHEYVEGNIYWSRKTPGSRPRRSCRTCVRARSEERYLTKRKLKLEERG